MFFGNCIMRPSLKTSRPPLSRLTLTPKKILDNSFHDAFVLINLVYHISSQ